MQKNKKQAKPQKPVEACPAVDDFFTQFLDKKKRNYTKKLDKIDALQKKNSNELTPEQKDLVNNRQKVVDDANYYDEIKNLYYQANAKKETAKPTKADTQDLVHSTVSLFYVGNCAKESGETAMRVLGDHGVEFQEKIHRYHNRVFHADYHIKDELKRAEDTLAEYLKDSEICERAGNIISQGKLTKITAETKSRDIRDNEPIAKPQLFAMSSDDEDDDETPIVHNNSRPERIHNIVEQEEEIKPTLVLLPEDDNEEGYGFETGHRSGDNEKRGRRPRGDKPYRKYEGERREAREPREPRESGDYIKDNQDKERDGENKVDRPRARGRGYRGYNQAQAYDDTRERGDRKRPYGRGRGRPYNNDYKDEETYQRKEENTDKQYE